MPATPGEMARVAQSVADMSILQNPAAGLWSDGTEVTDGERRDVYALAGYIRRLDEARRERRRVAGPQRVAMRLLRSLLNAEQARKLRTSKYFYANGRSGRTYRISPTVPFTEQAERHGRHWFATRRFCLHDDRTDGHEAMPPADLAAAHLLMIRDDDGRFLALANATDVDRLLWNGDYLRRVRAARDARVRAARDAAENYSRARPLPPVNLFT